MSNMFGSTLKETKEGFKPNSTQRTQAIGRIIITILLLGLATALLFMVQENSIGELIIGAVIGYWLK